MKGRRITFELLELYDWQGVERRLERQAAKGWRLEKDCFPLLVLPPRQTSTGPLRRDLSAQRRRSHAAPRPRSTGAGRRMHGRRLGKDLRLERDADLF